MKRSIYVYDMEYLDRFDFPLKLNIKPNYFAC